jgi:hypothetical protein
MTQSMEATMKLTPLISSLFLSLLLLPQSAQADISKADAQKRLKTLGKVMRDLGPQTTFKAINTRSAQNSTSPNSRDQQGLSEINEALNTQGEAGIFCVRNDMLVASTLHPMLANGTLNVMTIQDSNGEQPFVKMKAGLHDADQAVVEVTNVFPDITDTKKHKSLTDKHLVMVFSRRGLIGDAKANENPDEKLYCGITDVRD